MGQKKPRPAMKLFLFILLIGWGLLIAPALVNADGETRPPTREEKEFYKTVQTTIAQALPANGPTGWDEGNRSGIEELASIGIGEGASTEEGLELPLRVDYYVSWQDSVRIEAANEAVQEALSQQYAAQQTQPDNVEMEKLFGQLDKLGKELEKAFNAGDMDQVTKLQAEMEKIGAKISGTYNDNDAEQEELLKKMASHDVKAKISVVANSFSREFYRPVQQEDSVAGGLVYRSEGEFSPNHGWEEGYTYIFLGKNWGFKDEGSYGLMEAAGNKGLSNLTVQTIIVQIQADPARARELIEKIDWECLQKLIQFHY